MSIKKAVSRAVDALTVPDRPEPMLTDADYLSFGVTTLNLATFGKTFGGLPKGTINRVVGRKESGKSFLCSTILAEAARNPNFKDYELIYDDREHGRRTDVRFFFGAELEKRIRPPAWVVNKDTRAKRELYSQTVGDFYGRLKERLRKGTKLIWVIDSLDALDSDGLTKMTDGKAKGNNWGLREIVGMVADTGSIVLLISQARPDMKNPFGGDVASGGLSLEFFPAVDVWLRKVMGLVKSVRGITYNVGTLVQAAVKKNRVSGKIRTVSFPFSPDYGIDDIGSCVDYLCHVKHWAKEPLKKGADNAGDDDNSKLIVSPRKIAAPEFDYEGDRRGLIAKIERDDLARELRVLTGKVWHQIEDELREERKPRYA